jgi:hypothetical protein
MQKNLLRIFIISAVILAATMMLAFVLVNLRERAEAGLTGGGATVAVARQTDSAALRTGASSAPFARALAFLASPALVLPDADPAHAATGAPPPAAGPLVALAEPSPGTVCALALDAAAGAM